MLRLGLDDAGDEFAAVHRHEVGREAHRHRPAGGEAEFLLHFGHVAVMADAIGVHRLGDFGEEIGFLQAAAGARDARQRVDGDALGRDRAGLQQRQQRQQHRRRVAAGAGDEVGAGQCGAGEFGEAIDGARQQVRRRVRPAVPMGIGVGVLQAEIGGEVDDLRAP